MAITQAVCNSFKTQLLQGVHIFTNVTATAGSVAAGTGVYTVTLTGGANNGLTGQVVVMAAFGTAANNGTFVITASNATTITTTNTNSANSGAMGTCTIGDTFKIALYTSAAALDKNTTNYSATNEVGASGTYSAGGGTLVSTTPVLSTDTSCCLFNSISWTSATITARGAVVYNTKVLNAAGGASCIVLNFTTDQTSTAGTFTINFPAQTAGNAIIGLA